MRRVLLRHVLPPVVLFLVVLVAWQAAVTLLHLPRYLLPGPADVVRGAARRLPELATATGITGAGAVCGFAGSIVLGTLTALVFSQSGMIRSSCYPYAIFLQTVPIVAVAPLIVTWFGTGFHSVVIIACVISLFPIVTSVTTGLITIDRGLQDLFRLHRATRWQILCKLQIPNAVPYLVTGARTSSGLAVVGAIVGEFFVGYGTRHHGLGFIILYAGPQLKTDQLFAATFASALLGVAMFAAVTVTGKVLLARWHETPLN